MTLGTIIGVFLSQNEKKYSKLLLVQKKDVPLQAKTRSPDGGIGRRAGLKHQ